MSSNCCRSKISQNGTAALRRPHHHVHGHQISVVLTRRLKHDLDSSLHRTKLAARVVLYPQFQLVARRTQSRGSGVHDYSAEVAPDTGTVGRPSVRDINLTSDESLVVINWR